MTSVLTAFFLALWAPNISAYVSLFRPTCANPEGLVEVPHHQLEVRAASMNEQRFPAQSLIDGDVANIWVPPMLGADERPGWMSKRDEFAVVDPDASRVEIALAQPEDVQLLCVVNGLANRYENYVNWGRVRSVAAWTQEESDSRSSVLKSLDNGSFQSFQDVSVPRGDTDQITIDILDLYEGQQTTSVDPDVCGTRDIVGEGIQNDPIGCNLNSTARAGFAEIKVYRLEQSRWKALLPSWLE